MSGRIRHYLSLSRQNLLRTCLNCQIGYNKETACSLTWWPIIRPVAFSRPLLHAFHLHAFLQSPLTSTVALSEKGGTTKGASKRNITESNITNVIKTGDSTLTDHAVWYLNFNRKVGIGGQGQADKAVTRSVLDNSCALECLWVSCGRVRVNSCSERPRSILVNLDAV